MVQTLPRLLHITRNLPPLLGGMERLNWHMAKELAREYRVRIVGPLGAAKLAPSGISVDEVPLRPLWFFLVCGVWQALRIAVQWKPDVVLAGSGLTAPIAWLAARVSGGRAAVYVHGLDVVVDNPLYRLLWLPFIRRMDRVFANSRATFDLAIAAGVDAGKISIVHPGVQLPVADAHGDANVFRCRHRLGDGPILLTVGRLTQRKGIREFVSDILPHIVERHPDVMLAVIGDVAPHALAASCQSPESIQLMADQAGVGANLRFLGRVSDEELEEAFAAASVHVFPVRELPGDPEGFGMVAIEAAARGIPTVAFATGGVVDAVLDGYTGVLVSCGDVAGFSDAVCNELAKPRDDAHGSWKAACVAAAANFGWRRFGDDISMSLGIGRRGDYGGE